GSRLRNEWSLARGAKVVPRNRSAGAAGGLRLLFEHGSCRDFATCRGCWSWASEPKLRRPRAPCPLTHAEPDRTLAAPCFDAGAVHRPFVLPIIRKGAGLGGLRRSVAAG